MLTGMNDDFPDVAVASELSTDSSRFDELRTGTDDSGEFYQATMSHCIGVPFLTSRLTCRPNNMS
jgi:hypothetical protein